MKKIFTLISLLFFIYSLKAQVADSEPEKSSAHLNDSTIIRDGSPPGVKPAIITLDIKSNTCTCQCQFMTSKGQCKRIVPINCSWVYYGVAYYCPKHARMANGHR